MIVSSTDGFFTVSAPSNWIVDTPDEDCVLDVAAPELGEFGLSPRLEAFITDNVDDLSLVDLLVWVTANSAPHIEHLPGGEIGSLGEFETSVSYYSGSLDGIEWRGAHTTLLLPRRFLTFEFSAPPSLFDQWWPQFVPVIQSVKLLPTDFRP